MSFIEPVGCSECRDGYQGRVGIYEVMKVTPEIAELLWKTATLLIKDAG